MPAQSIEIWIEPRTNARAICDETVGAASVGESSLTSAASASKDAETPAELMPFQTSDTPVLTDPIRRNGLVEMSFVLMIVGSSRNGMA